VLERLGGVAELRPRAGDAAVLHPAVQVLDLVAQPALDESERRHVLSQLARSLRPWSRRSLKVAATICRCWLDSVPSSPPAAGAARLLRGLAVGAIERPDLHEVDVAWCSAAVPARRGCRWRARSRR
jgi:hypothetical protein